MHYCNLHDQQPAQVRHDVRPVPWFDCPEMYCSATCSMATGCAGNQEPLQGHALERVADRRALASTSCSMATGCAGDQEPLQG
ncbi:hypothetical protein ACSZOM_21140, partial [Aeromonas hydrophila]